MSKLQNLKQNRLALSNTHIQVWANAAQDITKILDDLGIKYVLMKALNVPYVHMDDVDLLIEKEDEVHETLGILRKKGYSLFRDRYSLNDLKTTAIPSQKSVQIDIYPEPAWFNMRYAPDFFITSTRMKRMVWGFEAYMPTPTLDMYIVATHSYNHGFISLAEAAHVVRLILENRINWHLLKNLADAYKLNHALFAFLRIAQLSLSENETDRSINRLTNNMLQEDSLSRIYSRWFAEDIPNGFPLKIPLTLRLYSAYLRLFRFSLWCSNTKSYDELSSHALAFFFRGGRRKPISRE